jgi:undecaprenyl-diphosphatase
MFAGGVVLLFIDNLFNKNNHSENAGYKQSFIIGCFQVLSIIFPGLSRSAATIIGGMTQGLTKKAAAEFSFFLAVPTMLAASLKSTLDVHKDNPEVFNSSNIQTLALGGVIAFIVALISVQFFIKLVQTKGFKIFGWYRIVIAVIIFALLFLGKIQ